MRSGKVEASETPTPLLNTKDQLSSLDSHCGNVIAIHRGVSSLSRERKPKEEKGIMGKGERLRKETKRELYLDLPLTDR